jgi:hypothetical protein
MELQINCKLLTLTFRGRSIMLLTISPVSDLKRANTVLTDSDISNGNGYEIKIKNNNKESSDSSATGTERYYCDTAVSHVVVLTILFIYTRVLPYNLKYLLNVNRGRSTYEAVTTAPAVTALSHAVFHLQLFSQTIFHFYTICKGRLISFIVPVHVHRESNSGDTYFFEHRPRLNTRFTMSRLFAQLKKSNGEYATSVSCVLDSTYSIHVPPATAVPFSVFFRRTNM